VSVATARVQLLRPERPWLEHLALYSDLFSHRAVAEALRPASRSRGRARPKRDAGDLLGDDIRHWEELRFGPWIFFERSTGVFVGRGGLRRTTLAGVDCVEVLYAIRPDAWGRGYATEIASLAVGEGRRLRLPEVLGVTATSNLASRRVLEKAGLRIEGTVEHAGLPHWLGRVRTGD
jgi:RimJ/RimL family protein N-acetyltransferase